MLYFSSSYFDFHFFCFSLMLRSSLYFSSHMFDTIFQLRSYCYRLFGCSLSEVPLPLRVLVGLAACVVRNLLLLYPLTTFMLLDWNSCYTVSLSTQRPYGCYSVQMIF